MTMIQYRIVHIRSSHHSASTKDSQRRLVPPSIPEQRHQLAYFDFHRRYHVIEIRCQFQCHGSWYVYTYITSKAQRVLIRSGMFARRAVAQSLAREFGPQGIHVAHVVVDGLIDTPGLREKMGEDKDEKVRSYSLPKGCIATSHSPIMFAPCNSTHLFQRLNPDEIAEVSALVHQRQDQERMEDRAEYVDIPVPHPTTSFRMDSRTRYKARQI